MPSPHTIFIAADFVLDPALDSAAERLREQGHTVVRGPRAVPGRKTVLPPERLGELVGAADVIVATSRVVIDDAVLDAAPRLRGVVFPSIGTESLDLAEAGRRGLMVANGATPENFQSMAEATIMLMLNLSYDLRGTEDLLRRNAPRPAAPRARMLQGKTVGLVGFGRIARAVADRLRGWNVEILASSPRLDPAQVPAGVRAVALDTLLRASDIVSLHTTLTPGSRHLIGPAELRRMKPGAFLLNTARGACVDEAAVHQALRDGLIAGAALDAFEVEPLPPDSPLRQLDNAILTPHMAGHTQELYASFAPACVRNVEAILAGELPPHACNPSTAPAWRERLAGLDGARGGGLARARNAAPPFRK